VIVTRDDHDYVDVTITSAGGSSARTSTITTTYHHPFYDRTRESFVDAVDLRVGDRLQTADGGSATITALRRYHATQLTYDLTVDGLHTYYVAATAAGSSVLVHNCNGAYDWTPGNRPGIDTTPQSPLPKDAALVGANAVPGEGRYIFVVMKDGSFRGMDAAEALALDAGHTSLAEEGAVHMAGTFRVNELGQIFKFDNYSGHYGPKEMPGFTALEDIARAAFQKHGLPAPLENAWKTHVFPW
jgi:hypothetical protein